MHQIIRKNENSMARELKQAFINDLIDQARKKDDYRRLYRNAQAGIRESDLFSSPDSPSNRRKVGFSFWRKNVASPKPVILSDDDIREIPFPDAICPGADYALVNQKKILIPLADYFISRVEEILNGSSPVIPLNLFIDWISRYTPLAFSCAPYDREEPDPDQGDETEAFSCAAAFSNRLVEVEAQVFFLYHCQGLSHEQVRLRMNRKSFATHQKEQVRTKLAEFLMPFSWEQNSGSFSLFIEKLCRILSQKFRTTSFKAV